MPTGDGTSAGGPASLGAKQRAEALIGHVVAERYRIERILAMGGMGAVFAGEHIHLHKDVAIKLLHPETKGLPELVARFERESMVGAHASHRNVAGATDFGKDTDGSYYLICELVDGINLKTLMKRGEIPVERAVDIARQIAEGLHAIHELDIVHRDLNPRNVMVSVQAPDRVKLIDFGFAKVPVGKFDKKARRRRAHDEDAEEPKPMSLTAEGMVFGTVGFMAPEAAFGMAAVDKPADLYALGVILYEMLTGKHPYDAEGQKALFKCHAMDPPPPFAERAPERAIPAVYEAITMKLLDKDPGERYASATDVLDALDEAVRAPVTSGTSTREQLTDDDESPWTRREEPGGKRRVGLIVALALVVAAGVVLSQRSIRDKLLGAMTTTTSPPPSGAVTVAPPTGTPKLDLPEPTATATATAAPRPTAVAGLDADAWVSKLRQAVAGRSTRDAAAAIEALVDIDPDRLGAGDLVAESALAVVNISLTPDADATFALLASERAGAAGPDIFYRLVAFHGGSKAARRAEEILADEKVWARASEAMKIAHEIRTTPCQKRAELLERAGDVGDRRTLLLLSNMTPRDCSTCCLHAPGLGPAIRKLSNRLK